MSTITAGYEPGEGYPDASGGQVGLTKTGVTVSSSNIVVATDRKKSGAQSAKNIGSFSAVEYFYFDLGSNVEDQAIEEYVNILDSAQVIPVLRADTPDWATVSCYGVNIERISGGTNGISIVKRTGGVLTALTSVIGGLVEADAFLRVQFGVSGSGTAILVANIQRPSDGFWLQTNGTWQVTKPAAALSVTDGSFVTGRYVGNVFYIQNSWVDDTVITYGAGVPSNPIINISELGNSLFAGDDTSGGAATIPNQCKAQLIAAYPGYDFVTHIHGHSGENQADLNARYASECIPDINPSAAKNYLVVNEVINAITAFNAANPLATAQQGADYVYGLMRDLYEEASADDWDAIFFNTGTPRTNVGVDVGRFEAVRAILNPMILDGATPNSPLLKIADRIFDPASVPQLMDSTNTTYYANGVHPNDTGAPYYAQTMTDAISDDIDGAPVPDPVTIINDTYTGTGLLSAHAAETGGTPAPSLATPAAEYMLSGGRAYKSSTGINPAVFLYPVTPSVDTYTLTGTAYIADASSTFFGFVFCANDDGGTINWYQAVWASGTWYIVSVTNNSAAVIGTNTAQGLTVGQSYAITIDVTSTSITLKVDGATKAAANDTGHARTAGKIGITYNGAPASPATGSQFASLQVIEQQPDPAPTPVILNVNDTTKVSRSPFGWQVIGSTLRTINTGNGIKGRVTGTATITLAVDMSVWAASGADANPILRYRIDGGAWQRFKLLADTTEVALATGLSTGTTHTYEVQFGGIDDGTNLGDGIWSGGCTTLVITGVILDNGGTGQAAVLRPYTMFGIGDSKGQGADNSYGANNVRPGGESDTVLDSTKSWPQLWADKLNAEASNTGFGQQGLLIGGGGGVPKAYDSATPANDTIRFHRSGVARVFASDPDFLVINLVTNDTNNGVSDADYTAAFIGYTEHRRTQFPATRIIWLVSEGQEKRVVQIAALASYKVAHPSDPNVYLADAGGNFLGGSDSPDGIHPNSDATNRYVNAGFTNYESQLAPPTPGALTAGTLSGPTSTTKSRLNEFTFTPPTGGEPPYTYQGQRKKSVDATWADVSSSFASPFDVKNLLPDTTYNTRARQTDNIGNVVYTNTITATTDEAPPPPDPGSGGYDMASFPGTPLFYEPVVFDADMGGPGCMYGLRVASAGTVVVQQRDTEDATFVLSAPGNIQGDFLRVRSDGTDVEEEDITIARR